jgi:hypothetical protein
MCGATPSIATFGSKAYFALSLQLARHLLPGCVAVVVQGLELQQLVAAVGFGQ